jgi:hypothetical protein
MLAGNTNKRRDRDDALLQAGALKVREEAVWDFGSFAG